MNDLITFISQGVNVMDLNDKDYTISIKNPKYAGSFNLLYSFVRLNRLYNVNVYVPMKSSALELCDVKTSNLRLFRKPKKG